MLTCVLQGKWQLCHIKTDAGHKTTANADEEDFITGQHESALFQKIISGNQCRCMRISVFIININRIIFAKPDLFGELLAEILVKLRRNDEFDIRNIHFFRFGEFLYCADGKIKTSVLKVLVKIDDNAFSFLLHRIHK